MQVRQVVERDRTPLCVFQRRYSEEGLMDATVRSYTGSRDLVDELVKNESEVKRLVGDIDGSVPTI